MTLYEILFFISRCTDVLGVAHFAQFSDDNNNANWISMMSSTVCSYITRSESQVKLGNKLQQMRLPLVPECWYVLAHGDETPVTRKWNGVPKWCAAVQSINNVSVQCPVLPHKRNCSGTTGQKLMKELLKLYMIEGTSNWVKVTHAKSIVEYGRNLDGHLMF